MNGMKKIITTILAIAFLNNFIFSQDIIHLRKGSDLKTRNIEIGRKKVKYKSFDIQDNTDYFIKKRKIEYILYKNGKKDFFYNNLNSEEYSILCKRKIIHFKKQKDVALVLSAAGIISTSILAISFKNRTHRPYPENIEQGMGYFLGFVFTVGTFATGTALYFSGESKIRRYSKELKNISFGVNLFQKQKGISLSYRF